MALRLKELRLAAGLTQQELGDKVGLTHAQIGRMENGKRGISSDRVMQLAAALSCHPGELFRPIPAVELSPTQRLAADIAANLGPDDAPHWLQIGASLAKPRSGDGGNGKPGRRSSAA